MDHPLATEYEDLACPECGSPMELCFSWKHRLKTGRRRPFYRCVNYPECPGTHGAHPNGAPLGIPGDTETKKLRTILHEELAKKWPRNKKWAREATCFWLKENGFNDGHIGKMSAEECRSALKMLGRVV